MTTVNMSRLVHVNGDTNRRFTLPIMTGDQFHETDTEETPPTAPIDTDRYASVTVDHEETIIYDREHEEAWIQADTARSLGDLQ